MAVNYAIYRNEVFRYVYEHRGLSGDIPLASLNMPESWRALRAWRARVDAGRCYVYGEASPQEIAAVRPAFPRAASPWAWLIPAAWSRCSAMS